jgi:hypothetical protein
MPRLLERPGISFNAHLSGVSLRYFGGYFNKEYPFITYRIVNNEPFEYIRIGTQDLGDGSPRIIGENGK